MSPQRPDPDALLARVKDEEARARRGKLKIFFGAAAGVGKTYAMLEAAREQRADGRGRGRRLRRDARPRRDRGAARRASRSCPAAPSSTAAPSLREFDLDAALARRPALVLVDELAHTNAPGSRHAKRWQDVVELLDAGHRRLHHASTSSTSRASTTSWRRITGVVVRETVPDSVLEQADEVELIDLPPDDLLQRLREGKVYVPGQAEEAAGNFFRKGNLIALRELALRRTAERVDAQMRGLSPRARHRRRSGRRPSASSSASGPSPSSARLVRAAKRMADRLGAEWIAAYVETPAQLAAAGRRRGTA